MTAIISTTCYDNIIGLSRTECECYDSVATTQSDSGLYLDELSGLRNISSILNCESGTDIWEKFDRARDWGIRKFISDSNSLLMKHNKLRRKPFKGELGRAKWSQDISGIDTNDWIGTRFYLANVVDGIMKVKRIGAITNKTGTLDIYIYNNLNELVDSVTINTVAGQHTITDITDIELDMHNGYRENLEYFFIYQYDGSNTPKNNELDCCGAFEFNTLQPCFYRSHARQSTCSWKEWMMVGGFKRSDISDLSDLPDNSTDRMYGLTFDIELKCQVYKVLCQDEIDFVANPLAMSIAEAIQYKSAELLMGDILRSPEINRDILINREQAIADIEEWSARYNELIGYIVDNVSIERNDCLECEDQYGLEVSPILI